jgi:putative transposase
MEEAAPRAPVHHYSDRNEGVPLLQRRGGKAFDGLHDLGAEAGEKALATFEEGYWELKYHSIGQIWRRAWPGVIPFFTFPDEVRRIVHTTSATEASIARLRRAVHTRGHFPNDEATTKLRSLVSIRNEKERTMPRRAWSMAKAQLAVIFGERFIKAMA